jgi:hypothetical protein
MLGYTEQLEWLAAQSQSTLDGLVDRAAVEAVFVKAARATCDFYIRETPTCGVPYWDTGAPGLAHLGNYKDRPADPFNDFEPVDSSAAAIAAQGLLRLGHHLVHHCGDAKSGTRFVEAGLATARTIFNEPYLSTDPQHEGLLLHSVYHRPNGWDNIPAGRNVPCGESSMWGDYHARELAVYIQRLAENTTYHAFFGPVATQ